jgi:hypothetical protein
MGEPLKNYSTGVLKNPWGKATEAGTLRKKTGHAQPSGGGCLTVIYLLASTEANTNDPWMFNLVISLQHQSKWVV